MVPQPADVPLPLPEPPHIAGVVATLLVGNDSVVAFTYLGSDEWCMWRLDHLAGGPVALSHSARWRSPDRVLGFYRWRDSFVIAGTGDASVVDWRGLRQSARYDGIVVEPVTAAFDGDTLIVGPELHAYRFSGNEARPTMISPRADVLISAAGAMKGARVATLAGVAYGHKGLATLGADLWPARVGALPNAGWRLTTTGAGIVAWHPQEKTAYLFDGAQRLRAMRLSGIPPGELVNVVQSPDTQRVAFFSSRGPVRVDLAGDIPMEKVILFSSLHAWLTVKQLAIGVVAAMALIVAVGISTRLLVRSGRGQRP